MRRLGAILLLVVLAALPAQAEDSGLDRLTRRDQAFGWEAVGRLDIGAQGFCTGTLIATDLVLTAAHCLFDRQRGAPVDVGAMTFRAGLRDGDAVAEVQVQKAVAHPVYDPFRQLSEHSVRHDLALLHLTRPIPAAIAAPFVVQAPQGTRPVSVVSYAQGREDALSWQRSCAVLGRQDGLLAFSCDVDFGSSGAPVFDASGGRARIVSVISAGRKDAEGTVAFGMELPGLLADLKLALRTGKGVIVATGAAPAIRRIGRDDAGTRDIGARFVKP